jgi:ribonucleoside-diphosphate reductase alpha chain
MSLQALSDYTFVSRYARFNTEKNRRETWSEAVERVKNMHLIKYPMVRDEIEWAFSHVHNKVALGSQRALQFGGEPILKKNARIYNCISSYIDRPRVFQETFWLLLCGCGTGFSVQTHHVNKLPEFHSGLNSTNDFDKTVIYQVDDSIEGWADALGVMIASYLPHDEYEPFYGKRINFDFSKIRPKGSLLSYGVGRAPGPDGLASSLVKIQNLLDSCLESGRRRLRSIDAYDIIMHSSDAVLSGGVRRSATLCIFSPEDTDMLNAKIGDWYYTNPQRARSNNSALLIKNSTSRDTYHRLFESTRQFGEPGLIWADNSEALYNPCVEIGLYAYDEQGNSGWQACNLSTINGSLLTTKSNFAVGAEVAAVLGTLQAGYTDFAYLGPVSESIIRREALLGVSITGIMDHPKITLDKTNLKEMAQLVLHTNERIAEKIGINVASRTTCVKPEGTASCLLGTSSGVHPSHARKYIRRVQSNAMEAPVQHYKLHNPSAVQKSVWSANGTDEVINFLIEMSYDVVTKDDITAVQLLETVKLVQENWVDSGKRTDKCVQPWLSHNVSNTINVKSEEWPAVEEFIYENRKSFAGISLLGSMGDLDYPQAPFTKVLSVEEIVEKYGKGALFASGLIVDALHAFNNNLWQACDAVLGNMGVIEPSVPLKIDDEILETLTHDWKIYNMKLDWIRRAKQFAERYVNGDIRQLTYLLKDVNNTKFWQDLSRDHLEVKWELLYEEEDNTKLQENVACGANGCEMK